MRASLCAVLVLSVLAVPGARAFEVRALLADPVASSPITAVDPTLRDALRRIARGSHSWRQALERLAADRRRIVVLTPDDVVVQTVDSRVVPFEPTAIAEVSPVADASGNVSVVMVVVNVAAIRAVHEPHGSLPGEIDADIERILAHEVYGHAVPYLEVGHVSGRCADPGPGDDVTSACAIRRENVIRAELRLGRRTDAALGSLALSRLLPR